MNMRNVILTGHSGFLGTHIKTILKNKGYNIIGVGRKKNSDIVCDLTFQTFHTKNIKYVIHAAGKAHSIPKNNSDIKDFFLTNYAGTINLIKSISKIKINSLIFISSVSVYGLEKGNLIDENTPLNGTSPYSLSKIKAEKALLDYGKNNNVRIIIIRLPLVTGRNPKGNLYRMINAIKSGYYFRIGSGKTKKSLVSAFDIGNIIPELFEINGIYNLTDVHHPSISEIDSLIAKKLNKKIKVIPFFLARLISKFGNIFRLIPLNELNFNKLTKNLTFSNNKILKKINLKPSNGLNDLI